MQGNNLTSGMHVREWSASEVAAFNALFCRSPYAMRLRNEWPNRATELYVFRWMDKHGVSHGAAHFCEGEALWRADVYKQAGTEASVEQCYLGQGESYAVVDARRRTGCACRNCANNVANLRPIPKVPRMSAAQARRLARES